MVYNLNLEAPEGPVSEDFFGLRATSNIPKNPWQSPGTVSKTQSVIIRTLFSHFLYYEIAMSRGYQ
jgi:hypothetical protein